MDSFEQRKKGYESKFAKDQELKFKSEARRNKLLGAWAASKLGLTGTAAEDYIKSVVRSDLQAPGSEDVFQKLKNDFAAKGVALSDHQIRRTMDEMLTEAAQQIEKERAK
ncbi:MAG: DUF1476 domain-containing protein [Hyphomicrobiaceae bacterium]|nr:MAG: DUF1476 domain-containing protein [Hyphomicrobiaceae bacterium]